MTLLASSVQPALGWTNGGDGGQGFGTHDWVLARALVLAGQDGAWVNRTVAYKASDDPDTYDWNPFWHVFKENGGRGAPYAVSEHYAKAVKAYRAGDYNTASKHLGILSHYYSDANQPFHTTNKASKYRKTWHFRYEKTVGKYHYKPGNKAHWITPRPRQPVTDVRAKTIAAAKYARTQYPALIKSFRASPQVTKGTPNKITRRVLSRSVNDMADIIRSISKGEGMAPMPQKPAMRVTYRYPRQNQRIGAHVTVTNAAGQPMEGVAVNFIWKLPGGTKTIQRFTDPYGKIHWYENIGETPLMQQKYVTAQLPSSGEATSSAEWYMATKVLDDGTAGFKAWVGSYYVRPKADAVAYAQARDTNGNPVVGLPVTFTCGLDGYATQHVVNTDANGVARYTRNIGSLPVGSRVFFKANVQSGGYDRGSAASFEVK